MLPNKSYCKILLQFILITIGAERKVKKKKKIAENLRKVKILNITPKLYLTILKKQKQVQEKQDMNFLKNVLKNLIQKLFLLRIIMMITRKQFYIE